MNIALAIVGILLGVFGAISGIQWSVHKWQRRASVSGHKKAKKVLLAKHSDHVYRRLDLGCRISEGGRSWYVRRTAVLVSKIDALNSVEMHTHIYGLVADSFRDSVEPDSIKLEDVDAPHPYDMGRILRFPHALKLDQEQDYVYTRNFQKTLPENKSDLFTASASTLCDLLTVRVIFDGTLPAVVKYRVMQRGGNDVGAEETHTPDPLSGEVRKDISFPDNDLTYGFHWQYA